MSFGIGFYIHGITVTERDNQTHIDHLPNGFLSDFLADTNRAFGTSKIELNMFAYCYSSGNQLVVDNFFLPDLMFILTTIRTIKYRRTNVSYISKLEEQLKANSWLKNIGTAHALEFDTERLKDFNLIPKDHQEEFFNVYCNNVPRYNLRGYLLAAAPGAGKTFTSLALMRCLDHKRPVIIFSPKVAIYGVWEANLLKYTTFKPTYYISDRDKQKTFVANKNYYIFHYEDLELATSLLPWLRESNIIIDESHNFTDLDAKRTKLLVDFCIKSGSSNVLFMSGTPLKSIGSDAIPIFRSIDPYFNDAAAKRFSGLYGKSISRAVAVLANRIGMITYKVEKDAIRDVKPIEQDILVKFKGSEQYTLDNIKIELRAFIAERSAYYKANRELYQKYFDDAITYMRDALKGHDRELNTYMSYIAMIRRNYDPATMKDIVKFCNRYEKTVIIPSLPASMRANFKDAKSVVKYVDLKIQGEALARVIGKRRTDCVVDMIPHVGLPDIIANGIKKTIVFTSYVEAADATAKYLKELGFNPRIVYGDTTHDLSNITRDFANDPDINPLIATFKSLSTAVPLIMANTIVMLDQPFRHYIIDQTIARVDRLGQDTQTYIYNALLFTGETPNISTRSKDIMEEAKVMVEAIMGVKVDELTIATEDMAMDYIPLDTHVGLPNSLTW